MTALRFRIGGRQENDGVRQGQKHSKDRLADQILLHKNLGLDMHETACQATCP